jgi:prepilin-type N-terminal cleavage/methylation domain-containing protein
VRHFDGSLQVNLQKEGNTPKLVDMEQPFPTGKWVRLRIERSGSETDTRVTLFADGVPLIENVQMASLRANTPLLIGFLAEGEPGREVNAKLENFRLPGEPVMRTTLRDGGFTLIELLAVILIVAILSGVLITQLSGAGDAARGSQTAAFLQQLETTVGEYERERGAYPSSRFAPEDGVADDGENVGIEALVVALYSKGWEAGGHEIAQNHFGNLDDDQSGRALTDFGNKNLLEFVDGWGNPIAYLHRTDYGSTDRMYTTLDLEGRLTRTAVLAQKDPVQGRYYKHRSFQLISAGSDGVFNTEDDIYNFEKHKP